VLGELMLLGYCALIGFVTAGITASFYKLATSEPARFALLGEGAFGLATTFAFCAISGPAIIADLVVKRALPSSNTLAWLAGSLAVATLWSTCSGVLMVEFILALSNTV
jgi:hypothetical protein